MQVGDGDESMDELGGDDELYQDSGSDADADGDIFVEDDTGAPATTNGKGAKKKKPSLSSGKKASGLSKQAKRLKEAMGSKGAGTTHIGQKGPAGLPTSCASDIPFHGRTAFDDSRGSQAKTAALAKVRSPRPCPTPWTLTFALITYSQVFATRQLYLMPATRRDLRLASRTPDQNVRLTVLLLNGRPLTTVELHPARNGLLLKA